MWRKQDLQLVLCEWPSCSDIFKSGGAAVQRCSAMFDVLYVDCEGGTALATGEKWEFCQLLP